jgi:hypothetical protein
LTHNTQIALVVVAICVKNKNTRFNARTSVGFFSKETVLLGGLLSGRMLRILPFEEARGRCGAVGFIKFKKWTD